MVGHISGRTHLNTVNIVQCLDDFNTGVLQRLVVDTGCNVLEFSKRIAYGIVHGSEIYLRVHLRIDRPAEARFDNLLSPRRVIEVKVRELIRMIRSSEFLKQKLVNGIHAVPIECDVANDGGESG